MSQSNAALVIDLDDFRRRRAARSEARPATSAPAMVPPVPVWLVWVPVWFVA
jgi:hypothetical protein